MRGGAETVVTVEPWSGPRILLGQVEALAVLYGFASRPYLVVARKEVSWRRSSLSACGGRTGWESLGYCAGEPDGYDLI